jgi:ABC-type spermidine/putrescine transport system permease subunit II
LEINRLKYYIAPFIGACIALPILALLIFYILQGNFNIQFLLGDVINKYITDTSILVLGTFFLVVILGTISSYLSARFEYFGDKIFALIFVLPLAYPAYILGYTYVGFIFLYFIPSSSNFDSKSVKVSFFLLKVVVNSNPLSVCISWIFIFLLLKNMVLV